MRYDIRGTDFDQGVLAALRAYPTVQTVQLTDTGLEICLTSEAIALDVLVGAIQRAGGTVTAIHPLDDPH